MLCTMEVVERLAPDPGRQHRATHLMRAWLILPQPGFQSGCRKVLPSALFIFGAF